MCLKNIIEHSFGQDLRIVVVSKKRSAVTYYEKLSWLTSKDRTFIQLTAEEKFNSSIKMGFGFPKQYV